MQIAQQGKTSPWTLAVLFGGIGLVSAVVVPVYNDKEVRAQFQMAQSVVNPWKQAVAEFYARNKRLPAGGGELPAVETPPAWKQHGSVTHSADGVLTLVMAPETGAGAGKTVVYRPSVRNGSLEWDCREGTLENKFRMVVCRSD